MHTMTFYRHTYSVVFLFSYKALCPLCIYSIFAWFRTSGVTYFSSNSYWPVSVVYFLAFLFWAGVFLNKRWLGSNIYCNARAGITRVLMKDTQHNWTASHPPHSVTQCYTVLHCVTHISPSSPLCYTLSYASNNQSVWPGPAQQKRQNMTIGPKWVFGCFHIIPHYKEIWNWWK